MSFFTVNKETAAKQSGGSGFISKSGVYDVTINAVTVDVNDNGARTLGFYVNVDGKDQMLYGALRLDDNDGSANFQAEVFNKLCALMDLEDVQPPEEATLPIGKGGADKNVAVLPDFVDVDMKMWVQFEYSLYNGEIKERKQIKAFYLPDGTSADEYLNGTESGVRFTKDSKYHENTKYDEKSGITAEDVEAWVQNGRRGGATKKAAPKVQFGKPKFGSK